jgi:hypothetical protein
MGLECALAAGDVPKCNGVLTVIAAHRCNQQTRSIRLCGSVRGPPVSLASVVAFALQPCMHFHSNF